MVEQPSSVNSATQGGKVMKYKKFDPEFLNYTLWSAQASLKRGMDNLMLVHGVLQKMEMSDAYFEVERFCTELQWIVEDARSKIRRLNNLGEY